MRGPEARLEDKDREDAKANGWFVEKIMQTGRSGFPDRFYAKRGVVLLIEWKRPDIDRRLSAIQAQRHKELKAHGVLVYTIDTLADAKRIRDAHDLEI